MKYIAFSKTFIARTIKKGRSFEGTGLGLALTQALVNLHGGKMEVESTFGHGTTFTVYVPVGTGHLPPNQVSTSNTIEDNLTQYGQSIVDEAERWGAPEGKYDTKVGVTIAESSSSSDSGNVALPSSIVIPPSTRGCKVLIADDNEDMRHFVRGVLLQFYEVLEAPNGQIALSMTMEQRPDLILSDIMMPGLDGFGLLKVLRSSSQMRSIPFVLLSAYADDKARVDGLVAGADDYLAKTFSPKELIARVHSLLENARMRVELEKRVREVSKDLMESEERFR
jgi:CheY-like chemotaxis protein